MLDHDVFGAGFAPAEPSVHVGVFLHTLTQNNLGVAALVEFFDGLTHCLSCANGLVTDLLRPFYVS